MTNTTFIVLVQMYNRMPVCHNRAVVDTWNVRYTQHSKKYIITYLFKNNRVETAAKP